MSKNNECSFPKKKGKKKSVAGFKHHIVIMSATYNYIT